MKKLLLIMGLLLVLLLAACGGDEEETATNENSGNDSENTSSENNDSEDASSEDEEPTEVRIMSHFFSPTPPSEDNEVEQRIEEATNTELNIDWVSANNYPDRFNVVLASGDLPDLMLVPDPFSPVFRQAADQGAFWDVGPYIDDYPNFKKNIADIAWDLTAMNGKQYAIPRPRPSEGEGFFTVRKDWLDNLGLEEPTTTDELYEVMRAFSHDDPDGNGKDDTVGFIGYINDENMGSFGSFEGVFNGVNGEWGLQDGELVHRAFYPGTRDAIEYLAKAYEEGLIAADFASLQVSQARDIFKGGKAGVSVEKSGALQDVYDSLVQIDSDFEFKNLLPLTNLNGYNPKGPGFSGANAIPKSVPEEKMKKILAMYDRWMEEDVFMLHKHGIEGVHHTVEDGEIVIDTEKILADGIADHNQIVYVSDPYASTVKPTFPEEVQKMYADIQDEREKTSVGNIAVGLHSEIGITYLPELRKDAQDLKTKIILGSEPITAWDDFVEELKNDPDMQQLTKEINESYQSR
ncbi:extracellular solute-binding protein [Aquibacillus albus]|uniref:Aldouronate transport system substrate-binding protein n=1 Tax=Aquibacillus albus TaxID=1168171 RepID=A0ABS2N676_9BACI|nr:extracellular solute-binding protein [Aquibacillus albus]MBM7573548.1 putative aldouronate transport system substrate-binding protein [Aquibacillus albus]